MAKIIISKIGFEDNVILEYLPKLDAEKHKEYKVLMGFKNMKEAKKWIRENPEKIKELLKEYGPLYLTSVRACYLISLEGE